MASTKSMTPSRLLGLTSFEYTRVTSTKLSGHNQSTDNWANIAIWDNGLDDNENDEEEEEEATETAPARTSMPKPQKKDTNVTV
eukprot:CAMPEP_0197544324 /NCGR_PEP_ID=MMETSP1318-20131121/68711_1 /TAXON_ID=552666 /ORGANISM="Partenskyella glossopodia, Strain RCC365" /LENGTH=83 /DNA_ID=CAMNT_0043103719 /DNA_START=1404 /DNA_END=1652 /DNA_ORIENTATION=+